MKLRTFRIGGVHPEENKLSAESATQVAKLPRQAIFPLSQHIGAPAKPVVKKGDKVAWVGFGTFSAKKRAAREGINPLTKEPLKIPAKTVASFKAGSKLKDALN